MQVKSVGTLTKLLVNNLRPPPSPQAMLSFDDQTHIYTRKTIYLHFSTLYWGGGGGGGNYAQIVPLKITIVVPNDSLVIFWTVFTSVPTAFDLHCSFKPWNLPVRQPAEYARRVMLREAFLGSSSLACMT